MPTLHIEDGFAFFIVMFDCRERPHVHVKGNGKGGGKLWLVPAVELASPGQYNERELAGIRRIVRDSLSRIVWRWHEECVGALEAGGS